jgi:hypothetical protein
MNIFLAKNIVGIVVWLVNVVFFKKRKIRGSPIGLSEFEYVVYGLSLETGSPRKFYQSLPGCQLSWLTVSAELT